MTMLLSRSKSTYGLKDFMWVAWYNVRIAVSWMACARKRVERADSVVAEFVAGPANPSHSGWPDGFRVPPTGPLPQGATPTFVRVSPKLQSSRARVTPFYTFFLFCAKQSDADALYMPSGKRQSALFYTAHCETRIWTINALRPSKSTRPRHELLSPRGGQTLTI